MKLFWQAFGFLALILAFLGVALPLVPTTPFLLLAVYAFARSSPKMHDWILNHKQFGPLIHNWHNERAIAKNVKITAVFVLVGTFSLSLIMGVAPTILALQAVILTVVGYIILTRPTPSS